MLGVTTAATLWFVTVMGLCFGGGQLDAGHGDPGHRDDRALGLKWCEDHIARHQRGTMVLVAAADGPSEDQIRRDSAGGQFPDHVQRRRLRQVEASHSLRTAL